jgi:hypothetical protein
MADAGGTGTDGGEEDNGRITEMSDDEDLRLDKSAAQSRDTGAEDYTLRDEFRVIADDMKDRFKIPHDLRLRTNWPA